MVSRAMLNWDLLCYILIGVYQVTNSGLLSIPLSVLVLAYGICIARKGERRVWVFLFWYCSWLVVCKFLLFIWLAGTWDTRLIYSLYGSTSQSVVEIALLICLLVQIKLLKQYGTFYQALSTQ
jgi:hypothetical protein